VTSTDKPYFKCFKKIRRIFFMVTVLLDSLHHHKYIHLQIRRRTNALQLVQVVVQPWDILLDVLPLPDVLDKLFGL